MTGDACPICGGERAETLCRRPAVPVHQHLLMDTPADARAIERGRLDLAVCAGCGLGWNRAFDPSLLAYGASYDNAQLNSPTFADYVAGLVDELVWRRGVRDSRIVEVGCGKGELLAMLCDRPGWGNTAVGFDPSYVGPDAILDGRVRFRREFYGPDTADEPADAVLCRHLIEHIDRPVELLRVVRAAVDGSPHARVFIETPNLEWILDGQVIWDLCYEHCSLFSPEALARALTEAGFAVERIDHVFGGQYLFAEARPDTLSQARRGEPADSRQAKPAGSRPAELSAERSGNSSGTRGADIGQISPADIGGTHSANRPGTHPPCPVAAGKAEAPVSVATGAPSELLAAARRFANVETDIRRLWRERLAAEPGRLVLWGAGAKGVTLANLADPDAVLLAGVVDINPNKIGRFLPGTGHPILAPRELTARGIRHAVLMNPNYRREIAATLAETAPTIDLLEEP